MVTIEDLASLGARIGEEVAVSDWLAITQERINRFADATGDHQWIHVDVGRASKDLPCQSTIAHGFLTLSLVSILSGSAMSCGPMRLAINYGVNRVRFVSVVPAGSRIRGRFSPLAVRPLADASTQVTWSVTIEREGSAKPACVAEWVVRYHA
jgi:acyl dehydratase